MKILLTVILVIAAIIAVMKIDLFARKVLRKIKSRERLRQAQDMWGKSEKEKINDALYLKGYNEGRKRGIAHRKELDAKIQYACVNKALDNIDKRIVKEVACRYLKYPAIVGAVAMTAKTTKEIIKYLRRQIRGIYISIYKMEIWVAKNTGGCRDDAAKKADTRFRPIFATIVAREAVKVFLLPGIAFHASKAMREFKKR